MHYECDTEGGSSGSPVIDSNNFNVVGIHFAASYYCANLAKSMHNIWPLI